MALNLSQYLINNLGTVESTMLPFQYQHLVDSILWLSGQENIVAS